MTDYSQYYTIQIPRNYPETSDCREVVWKQFMPFDIIKGTDSVPPDNKNYSKYKKTHWWVCPRVIKRPYEYHDLSEFIVGLPVQEFTSVEKAVAFCIKWQKNWLKEQIKVYGQV